MNKTQDATEGQNREAGNQTADIIVEKIEKSTYRIPVSEIPNHVEDQEKWAEAQATVNNPDFSQGTELEEMKVVRDE